MAVPLTDLKIKNAKPAEKPYKLTDGKSLYLLVNATGRYWRYDYEFQKKRRTLALGVYPEVSLSQARQKHLEARQLLAQGTDPGAAKREALQDQQKAQTITFNAVADELVAKKVAEKRAKATLDKARWLLDFARADLGSRTITEITARDVLKVLQKVELKGNLETAKRLREAIGQVFRLAIATDRAESDPTSALRGAIASPVVTHRAAIVDRKQFGGLLRAIAEYDGQITTRIALQFAVLTAQRPGEIRRAEWSEFELPEASWTIPAARMKMRREHKVPLSPQAVALLKELHGLTGQGKFLFPSLRTVTQPISENTLNAALRRLGYTSDEVTTHGFRSTFSTLANESGRWSVDAIERSLAHVDANTVRRAYNRAAFWDGRVALMQWWADECADMRRNL